MRFTEKGFTIMSSLLEPLFYSVLYFGNPLVTFDKAPISILYVYLWLIDQLFMPN